MWKPHTFKSRCATALHRLDGDGRSYGTVGGVIQLNEQELSLTALLKYYDQVGIEATAVQCAVLEEVTYISVMKNGAMKAGEKAQQLTNRVGGWIGIKSRLNITPVESIAEVVMRRASLLGNSESSIVRDRILALLADRLGVDRKNLDLISSRVIEEAAAGYGISEDLLLSQQAEAIAAEYMKECIKGVQEQLRKQGEDEARVTNRVMAEQLESMTPAERLEIQKALHLDSLSASSLRNTFLKTGVPVAGIAALQAGGFGSYLALTTVMHSVFTGMLGITLPFAAYTTATSAMSILTGPVGILFSLSLGVLGYFWGQRKIERSQYAMIVWTCVGMAQGRLVPDTLRLPSVTGLRPLLGSGAAAQFAVPTAERADFESLRNEREQLVSAVAVSTRAHAQLAEANNTIERLQKRLLDMEILLQAYASQARLEDALGKPRPSLPHSSTIVPDGRFVTKQKIATLRKAEQEAQLVETTRFQVERLQTELQAAHAAKLRAEGEVRSKEAEVAAAESKHVSRLERRSKELSALWEVHFAKVTFRSQPLRWAAEQEFYARIEIERALRELADAPDPVSLSRSKMYTTSEHHMGFTIPIGVACRIFYVVEKGRIDVRKMCKKKDVDH